MVARSLALALLPFALVRSQRPSAATSAIITEAPTTTTGPLSCWPTYTSLPALNLKVPECECNRKSVLAQHTAYANQTNGVEVLVEECAIANQTWTQSEVPHTAGDCKLEWFTATEDAAAGMSLDAGYEALCSHEGATTGPIMYGVTTTSAMVEEIITADNSEPSTKTHDLGQVVFALGKNGMTLASTTSLNSWVTETAEPDPETTDPEPERLCALKLTEYAFGKPIGEVGSAVDVDFELLDDKEEVLASASVDAMWNSTFRIPADQSTLASDLDVHISVEKRPNYNPYPDGKTDGLGKPMPAQAAWRGYALEYTFGDLEWTDAQQWDETELVPNVPRKHNML